MATTIYLGAFSKRKNSTARPSLDNMASFSVVLKNGCSETSPVFFLSLDGFITYNYCVWEGKYYWITDINYTLSNRIIISCKMDVLATLKPYIQITSAFVLYDTSANTEIIDHRLSAKTTMTVETSSAQSFVLGQDATAIVTLTGKSTTAAFAMSISQASSLLNSISTWFDNVDVLPFPSEAVGASVMDELRIMLTNMIRMARQFIGTGNANEAIRNAIIVPVGASAISGTSARIYLGQYDTGINGTKVSISDYVSGSVDLSIPWQATDWRRNAPYHEFYLSIPYVGIVQLSPSDLIGEESIRVSFYMHSISGDAVFYVMAGSNKRLMSFNTNLSAPLALGSSNITPMQAGSAIAAGIGSAVAFAGSGGAAALATGSAGIMGVTQHIIPTLSSIGGHSGGASIGRPAIFDLISIYHDTNVEPASVSGVIGTPTMAAKSLGSVSGYCECSCASVAAPFEQPILDECNAMLNSGFFME